MTGVEEIVPLVFAALAGGVAGSAMSKSPPAYIPPKPMPLTSDPTNEAARRNALAQQQARRGRTSTILTGDDQKLGG